MGWMIPQSVFSFQVLNLIDINSTNSYAPYARIILGYYVTPPLIGGIHTRANDMVKLNVFR